MHLLPCLRACNMACTILKMIRIQNEPLTSQKIVINFNFAYTNIVQHLIAEEAHYWRKDTSLQRP